MISVVVILLLSVDQWRNVAEYFLSSHLKMGELCESIELHFPRIQ